MIIPFSSRVDRINKKTDILFDPDFKGARVDPDAIPAVDKPLLEIAVTAGSTSSLAAYRED